MVDVRETSSHVFHDCKALAVWRFRLLGHHFLKAGDSVDISVSRVEPAECLKQSVAQETGNSWSAGSLNCLSYCTILYYTVLKMGCICVLYSTAVPCIPVGYRYRKLKVCILSPLYVICVSNVFLSLPLLVFSEEKCHLQLNVHQHQILVSLHLWLIQ